MNKVYKADPLSRDMIRRVVKYLREITKTQEKPYFDIMFFLEHQLPKIFPDFELEILPESEMPNKCGETFPAANKIRLREDIYLKALDGDGYARFCVAHETGHFMLNDMDSISLCKLENGKKLKTYEDPEWQADAFAGELLMYHPLIKEMTVEDIVLKCGVTRSAARTQHSKI